MAKDNIIYSPRGIAYYPRLVRPDTKFKEDGEYKADILIPEAEALPFMKKLNVFFKNHTGKPHPKKPKLKENGQPSFDGALWYYPLGDDGNETGEVMFRCRVSNRRKKDGELWDRRPAQVDGKRKPIGTPIALGGGSVIRLAVEVYCWTAPNKKKGVSLQPVTVQVLKPVEGGSRIATDGFDDEDDAFDADQQSAADDFADEEEDTVGFDKEENGYEDGADSDDYDF